jgi:hypothetical protein
VRRLGIRLDPPGEDLGRRRLGLRRRGGASHRSERERAQKAREDVPAPLPDDLHDDGPSLAPIPAKCCRNDDDHGANSATFYTWSLAPSLARASGRHFRMDFGRHAGILRRARLFPSFSFPFVS